MLLANVKLLFRCSSNYGGHGKWNNRCSYIWLCGPPCKNWYVLRYKW